MGFMDKAKKMAEQAQTKLDDAQKQFNERQGSGAPAGGAAPVEYDAHGRPIRTDAPGAGTTPPHGDPVAPPVPAHEAPVAGPHAGEPPAPHGDPLAQTAAPSPPAPPAPPTPPAPSAPPASMSRPDDAQEDRNDPGHEPPKMSSGDPLAG